jgi:hypothetical protein
MKQLSNHAGAGMAALLALPLVAGALGAGVAVTEPEVGSFFRQAPEDALVRSLECDHSSAVRRQLRWSSELGVLLVESQVLAATNTASPEEIPLLNLTLRAFATEDPGWRKLTYRDEQWYGSTFWTGPDWTRVGKDWHHPGEQTPSVRCFRLPRDGQVTVTGRVYKLHLDGDGVRLSIRHGEREVWKAEIDGKDDKGVEPKLTFDGKKGEAIRFIVHKRGLIYCDTTHWDPVVRYADGETFQASKSFSTKQGQDGWSYQMPAEGANPRPRLLGIGSDLSFHEASLPEGAPFVATERDHLGFFALAVGDAKPGLVLAIDAAGPWSFRTAWDKDGSLRFGITAQPKDGCVPAVAIASAGGSWKDLIPLLSKLAAPAQGRQDFRAFAEQAHAGYRKAIGTLPHVPELDLFLLAQADWRQEDRITETAATYQAAVSNHLARAQVLLTKLQSGRPADVLEPEAKRLAELTNKAANPGQSIPDWRKLYVQCRLLKRAIALQNPLLSFKELLLCQRVPPSYSHLVGQYFGWRQRPGGGLYVVEQPGRSLRMRSVLGSQLPAGSYLEPCLSWDAKRVAFSFVPCQAQVPDSTQLPVNEDGPEDRYWHLYEANLDGSGLRQLTRGCYDDFMPCYLPDGGLAFTSTRRRGYSRCFGPNFSRRWHSYTLHRVDPDGSNLRILSVNDVSEWFPAVGHSGEILFARWDYIDRDAVTHQNLWAMRPDGANPLAVWGNASPKPHCTFQAKPIPNSPKIVFIASAHHSMTAGPVCVLDPTVDANSLEAIQRVTPGPFPEAESMDIPEYYQSPWPLSEDYFLVAYSPERLRWEGEALNADDALGIYLLDTSGNRELIFRDRNIGCTSPIPLAPRSIPTVVASSPVSSAGAWGEMTITDIYQGLGPVTRGAVKELRVIQIFPKSTWIANAPLVGFAGEENTRAILGTVPVEADGSARFRIPAHKPVLFQALDRNGFALQTMRSTTSVQPGERTSCVGCHEHRMSAPTPTTGVPLAMRREPSRLHPGEFGGEPLSFVRLVQPVLDKHCIRCHGGDKPEHGIDLTAIPQDGFTRSYWTLCGKPGQFDHVKTNPETAASALVPRFGMRNQVQSTRPGGTYGALGSRLMKMLRDGHNKVQLADAEQRRLAAWIDGNAVFHGLYDPAGQATQLSGKPVPMPALQ